MADTEAIRGIGHSVRRVEDDVHQMMPAGVQAEELAVEHVRKPGERMPVARMKMGKGPDQAFTR